MLRRNSLLERPTRTLRSAFVASLALACVASGGSLEAEREGGRPERPDKAAEAQVFQALQRQPGGYTGRTDRAALREALDPARYQTALRHMAAMPAYRLAQAGVVPPTTSLAPATGWTPLGPDNVGGRTRALVIGSGVMYAGGVGGGVWKSTDGGAHWASTGGPAANLAVSTLALDPAGVLSAGTGEGFFNADAVRGGGIFKSSDGGASWTQLPGSALSDFHYVNKVLVSPHAATTLYAATGAGVWRSLDGGATFSSFLSPTGGSGLALNGGCTDLAVRSDLPTDILFAACGTFTSGSDVAGIYRNLDAGGNGGWSRVYGEANMDRTSLAIAPSSQNVIYALAATSQSGALNEGLLAVLKSTDGGGTWSATVRNTDAKLLNILLLSNPEFGECFSDVYSQGWYDNVIAVDPVNPSRVWVGGIDLFRSDDGGANFGIASRWTSWVSGDDANVSHADRHALVFDPGYDGVGNQVLYVADDGGIQKTTNALAATTTDTCNGTSSIAWTTLNTGYRTAQFYYGAVYPGGATYFGGLQDNGTVRNAPASTDWDSLQGGDGGAVAVDPTHTSTLFAEFTGLSISKSVDGGANFSDATAGITEPSGDFLFITPFVIDPANPQVLWTGAGRLWRTTNQAGSWSPASAVLNVNQGTVSALAVAPSNDQRVIAGTTSGVILSSSAALAAGGSTTWSASQLSGNGYVSSVAFDPGNPLRAYATVSSFFSSHVWTSANGGSSWSAIDGSGATAIPDVPVNTVLVDPVNTQVLFAGSDIGCFISFDRGASWSTLTTGMGNAPIRHLVYDATSHQLFAFTHGLGAYSIDASQFESPAAPGALTAVAGSQQVSLSWTAASGATSYSVYQGTSAGGESVVPVQTGLTGTSTTVTGLTNGTTYFFVVRAVNSNGTSAASNEASAMPKPPPAAPTGVTAISGSQQVTLSWTAASGATSYSVYQGTSAGGESATPARSGIAGTSTTIPGLTGGVTYFFVVRAANSSGTSPDSSEVSATVRTAAPTSLAAVGGDAQVSLSWSAATGADSYNVYQGTNASGEALTPVQTGLTATSTVVSGLADGTTYFFTVRAVNSGGNSPASNEASAATRPPAPTITGGAYDSQRVTLNWSAAAGATSYNVYLGTSAGGESASPAQSGIAGTSATINGLTAGTTYYFVVRGVNGGGAGPPSAEFSVTLQPATPTGLAAVAGTGQVSLSWNASTGAASYNVYQGTSAGGESATAVQTGVTGTGTVVTGLADGTTYFFVVRARNQNGDGGLSDTSNEASATLTPPAPASLVAVAGDRQVTLNWNAANGATSYNLYQGTSAGGESATPVQTGITGTGATVTGLSRGATYFFVVRAVNGGGAGAASNEAAATLVSDAPAGLTASAGVRQVSLSWSAVSGATSYNIYQGTSAGGESVLPVAGVTGTGAVVGGLADGATYFFVVRAVNAGGTGAASNEASALLPPPAPANLGATPGSQQVTLSWSPANGATSYAVYQGASAGGESATPVQSGLNGTSAVVTGLADGATYFFVVRATNGSGTSPASSEISTTLAPPAVTGLGAVPGNQRVTLGWAPAGGAVSYDIYQGTVAGGEAATPVRAGIAGTGATVTGLANGSTYFFTVRAVNSGGAGPPSGETSATLAPPAPSTLRAATGPGQVTLSWVAANGAASYEVHQGDTSGGESANPAQSGITGTSATVAGLADGATYYFVVRALNGTGASPDSNEVAATLVPLAPTGLRAVAGSQQVTLDWNASSGATGYNVYVGTAAGAESPTPARSGIAGTQVTMTGLTDGTTYFFLVRAVNNGGASFNGSEVSATPAAPAAGGGGGGIDSLVLAFLAGAATLRRRRARPR